MENNRTGHISESELDGLLKQAFLDLDFEKDLTSALVLDQVAGHTMSGNVLSNTIKTYSVDVLFVLLSAFICLNGSDRKIEIPLIQASSVTEHASIVTVTGIPGKKEWINDKSAVRSDNIVTSTKKSKKHQRKGRSENRHGKIKDVVISSVPVQTPDLSASVEKGPVIKPTIALRSKEKSDSLIVQAPVVQPPSVAPVVRKIRPVRETTAIKSKKKVRSEKRRIRKLFQRNGTFMLKGNKYGKRRLR